MMRYGPVQGLWNFFAFPRGTAGTTKLVLQACEVLSGLFGCTIVLDALAPHPHFHALSHRPHGGGHEGCLHTLPKALPISGLESCA